MTLMPCSLGAGGPQLALLLNVDLVLSAFLTPREPDSGLLLVSIFMDKYLCYLLIGSRDAGRGRDRKLIYL
jgi:hypothetical protein